MAARIAGRIKTPDMVIRLLKEEVEKTSQAATARATGLTLRGVQNYLKGIGEPTQASLEKIAKYFGVSVAYLRGEEPSQKPEYWLSDDNFTEDQIKMPPVQFARLALFAESIMVELNTNPPENPVIMKACKFAAETLLSQAAYWLKFLDDDQMRADGGAVLSTIREQLDNVLQMDVDEPSQKAA